MKVKKTVHLTPDNHEYIRSLAFVNDSTIETEINQIISKKRELEGIKI